MKVMGRRPLVKELTIAVLQELTKEKVADSPDLDEVFICGDDRGEGYFTEITYNPTDKVYVLLKAWPVGRDYLNLANPKDVVRAFNYFWELWERGRI